MASRAAAESIHSYPRRTAQVPQRTAKPVREAGITAPHEQVDDTGQSLHAARGHAGASRAIIHPRLQREDERLMAISRSVPDQPAQLFVVERPMAVAG